MGSSRQPELPAWLESLRTSDRPAGASKGGQPGFSATDFFDEGTFPAWMKPENSDLPDASNSGKVPAWRPASMSAPNTDSEFLPPAGFPASSLIDEQSLPAWLQGKPAGADQPMPTTNISASSLVQPDALPDWLRNMPQSQQPPANQLPTSASNTSYPPQNNQAGMNYQPPAPQAFQAHELIDQQALPPWLAGQVNPPAQPNRPGQQAEFPYNHPASAQMPGQANPPSGIGASSLLDMNSLPAWLRESEQGQGRGHTQGQDMSQLYTGQPSSGNSNNNGGNLAAASLIDMNSLPGWLRSAEEGQGPQQASQGNARAPFGTTPRVENMRVPSRPRAEMGPYDQSEVAANVFSSMLGVASSAPYFPSASFPSGTQQGFQGEQFPQQQGQPPMGQMPASSPYPSGSMPQMNNATPGMQPGFAGQGYAQAGQQGYSMGNQPGGPGQQPPAYRAGAQPVSAGNSQRPITNPSATKPARRGIIDTIRSWFSH